MIGPDQPGNSEFVGDVAYSGIVEQEHPSSNAEVDIPAGDKWSKMIFFPLRKGTVSGENETKKQNVP